MKSLRKLSKQQIITVNSKLKKQFGLGFPDSLLYYLNERKRLYIVNSDFTRVDECKLIIDRVGLYVGEVKDKEIRLSKEGAQFLGEFAKKQDVDLINTVDLSYDDLKIYFKGEDMERDLGVDSRMILIMYGPQIVGCAKYKEGKIHNYHPKQHRGEVIICSNDWF